MILHFAYGVPRPFYSGEEGGVSVLAVTNRDKRVCLRDTGMDALRGAEDGDHRLQLLIPKRNQVPWRKSGMGLIARAQPAACGAANREHL